MLKGISPDSCRAKAPNKPIPYRRIGTVAVIMPFKTRFCQPQYFFLKYRNPGEKQLSVKKTNRCSLFFFYDKQNVFIKSEPQLRVFIFVLNFYRECF
jgi:hypothetical protein